MYWYVVHCFDAVLVLISALDTKIVELYSHVLVFLLVSLAI